eukprot:gnl/MRDRNA2_/MRDRNA2_118778_c0_seq1.p1 gnl/MRDRNA2_/MRDRNA2_118778_c0~~gnl/MRDRNA2_/MRDRNA2_118778_c0_seq1.p1  ORF type:complete len:314 (+),score=50.58 gnl/MRDRNA2_/MRDRNA2_118778_c0_seq1:196-1137(+)
MGRCVSSRPSKIALCFVAMMILRVEGSNQKSATKGLLSYVTGFDGNLRITTPQQLMMRSPARHNQIAGQNPHASLMQNQANSVTDQDPPIYYPPPPPGQAPPPTDHGGPVSMVTSGFFEQLVSSAVSKAVESERLAQTAVATALGLKVMLMNACPPSDPACRYKYEQMFAELPGADMPGPSTPGSNPPPGPGASDQPPPPPGTFKPPGPPPGTTNPDGTTFSNGTGTSGGTTSTEVVDTSGGTITTVGNTSVPSTVIYSTPPNTTNAEGNAEYNGFFGITNFSSNVSNNTMHKIPLNTTVPPSPPPPPANNTP